MSLEINLSTQVNLQNECKKHTGIYGWFQNLVGNTVAVVDNEKKTVYYHKVDLIKKLCLASNVDLEVKDIKKLKNSMIEVLHPVKGVHITAKKIETLFQDKLLLKTFKPE